MPRSVSAAPPSPIDLLRRQLLDTVRKYSLAPSGSRMLVAVSGGQDSTALLLALFELRHELGISLAAAHLNHGLRGAESEEDAEWVAELCGSLPVPLHSACVDVKAIRRRRHISLHEAGREARRRLLNQAAAETGAGVVAVGHTEDDRVETVLMNLLRGAGIAGLGGFPPRSGPIVRPLYHTPRSLTASYCAAAGVTPRSDSSNASAAYLRNRVRMELLPLLASLCGADVRGALLRMAGIASADNEVLEVLARESLSSMEAASTPDLVRLPAAALLALPQALQRRVVRQAIERVRGHKNGLPLATVDTILGTLSAGAMKSATFPDSGESVVRWVASSRWLEIQQFAPQSEGALWSVDLGVPGSASLPWNGTVRAELGRGGDTRHQPDVEDREVTRIELALAGIRLPLKIRNRRPGDRIRFAAGTRKLQDVLVDLRVPAARRHELPVVVDAADRIIAVTGLARPLVSVREGDPKNLEPNTEILVLTFAWTPIDKTVA